MHSNQADHVFISYVHEDIEKVDEMAAIFRSHGVNVWLDRDMILPGARWQASIKRAIQNGAFFLACFSEHYVSRDITYMNEELLIAIERLRQTSRERNWFIPVLLTGCEPPELSIGAGETLRDLQWVDLLRDWDDGITNILKVIAGGEQSKQKEGSQKVVSMPVRLTSKTSGNAIQPDPHISETKVDHANERDWRFGKGNCSNCAYPLSETEAVFEQGVGYVHAYDCLDS